MIACLQTTATQMRLNYKPVIIGLLGIVNDTDVDVLLITGQ